MEANSSAIPPKRSTMPAALAAESIATYQECSTSRFIAFRSAAGLSGRKRHGGHAQRTRAVRQRQWRQQDEGAIKEQGSIGAAAAATHLQWKMYSCPFLGGSTQTCTYRKPRSRAVRKYLRRAFA